MKKYALAGLFCLGCFINAAALAVDLQDFSQTEVRVENTSDVSDYRLALGSLKKINGQWQTETELRLDGQLERKTLQVTGGHSAAEAFDHYIQQLNEQANARELFRCQALKCGPSSSWANIQFKLKELYGLDKYQQYSVWTLDQKQYLTLYAVRRGNKRVYVHLEAITVSGENLADVPSTPVTILRALSEEGFYVLPPMSSQTAGEGLTDSPHIQSLVTALQRQRLMKVTIVAHNAEAATKTLRLERSVSRATEIKTALMEAGIAENRLDVFGAGGFAPSATRGVAGSVVLVKD